jgi:hypothetical protein
MVMVIKLVMRFWNLCRGQIVGLLHGDASKILTSMPLFRRDWELCIYCFLMRSFKLQRRRLGLSHFVLGNCVSLFMLNDGTFVYHRNHPRIFLVCRFWRIKKSWTEPNSGVRTFCVPTLLIALLISSPRVL